MDSTLTCADCGKPMRARAGSQRQGQATCHPCRRARPRVKAKRRPGTERKKGPSCARCGTRMHKGRGVLPQGQATCQPCRRAHRIKPPAPPRQVHDVGCRVCGVMFQTTRRVQIYCSATCRDSARSWGRFKPKADTTARGYGYEHQKARARYAAAHRDTDPCARCGQPLGPMGPSLHLDHDDNRDGYLGLSHAACNVRAGARLANSRREAECVFAIAPWQGSRSATAA